MAPRRKVKNNDVVVLAAVVVVVVLSIMMRRNPMLSPFPPPATCLANAQARRLLSIKGGESLRTRCCAPRFVLNNIQQTNLVAARRV